jgi:dephospho-CoA kinase
MIVIGLTGSIGMGKSTLAKQFRQCGAMVLDSDAVVHGLMEKGGKAVKPIAETFPGVEKAGAIDRQALGKQVFGNTQNLTKLEAILHPLVWQAQADFIQYARMHGKEVVVFDIPLLFETGGEKRCDYVVVATAPAFIQRFRVIRRMHMTEEKFAQILKRQMPDGEKRKRADFVVHTGLGKAASLKQVKDILRIVTQKQVKMDSPIIRFANSGNDEVR